MTDKRLRRRTPVRLKQIKNVANELSDWINKSINLECLFLKRSYNFIALVIVSLVLSSCEIKQE